MHHHTYLLQITNCWETAEESNGCGENARQDIQNAIPLNLTRYSICIVVFYTLTVVPAH